MLVTMRIWQRGRGLVVGIGRAAIQRGSTTAGGRRASGPASQRTTRRLILCLALLVTTLAPPVAASATPPSPLILPTCGAFGGIRICSGQVPSFDGTPLDVDLSYPARPGARHPLIILLHGFGNDKREWESTTDAADGADKWRWNSHWFARQGFYVLTYTARGFRTDPPDRGYEPATPTGSSQLTSPNATIHLKSRDVEIRDTQWLAALAAAAHPDLDPTRVAISGGSYGGGESWLQASQAQWTFPHTRDPSLPVLQLQVAVPKYPWTDLAYSLAPSGHGGGPSGQDLYEAAQGKPGPNQSGVGNPIGVVKQSYTHALFALGAAKGTFEAGTSTTPSTEGPINIPAWFARLAGVGDPYHTPTGADLDPVVTQARRGLTHFRSAYYQYEEWQAQVGKREVAIFSISGWTDDLFPALESFRMFTYLKRLDPRWPVAVAVADVGHPRAQNAPRTWRYLNQQAWQFLQAHIHGSHRQQTTVISLPTTCATASEPGQRQHAPQPVTAQAPQALANGQLAITYRAVRTLTSVSGLGDPNGPTTDPLAGFPPVPGTEQPCRVSALPALGGYTGISQPLEHSRTYVGLGHVEAPYKFTGQTGQLDARVWDVAPTGEARLITRGAYRIDIAGYDPAVGVLRLPLFGNHWRLRRGHRLRLDLSQVDQPFLRPSTPPSSITFTNPRLVLPTHEAGDEVLAGAE